MNDEQPCLICDKQIMLKIESYIYIADYKEGKFYKEGHYHNKCWHNVLHKKTLDKIQELTKQKLTMLMGGLNQ